MTETQIAHIRENWGAVAPVADQAAAIFYDTLFALNPSVKPMFATSDMTEQGKKLMQMLAVVVKGLDRLETILPAVEALGRRHGGYGVEDRHYDDVGAALIATLGGALGTAFTAAHRDAWIEAYGLLASVMKQAAAEPIRA